MDDIARVVEEVIKHLPTQHDQKTHGRLVGKTGYAVLKYGTKIGDKKSIDRWAKNSAEKGVLYHYSENPDAVLTNGFNIDVERSLSEGRGFSAWFGFDKTTWKGISNAHPIAVRINVKDSEYAWVGEDDDVLAKKLENAGYDYEKISESPEWSMALSKLGYKAWSDGVQVEVLDPSVIGIIDDYKGK